MNHHGPHHREGGEVNLELIAMRWLWLDMNCHYVIRERSPRSGLGEPDVLGVTKARYLIEIEIKRSLSDFNRDKDKWHRRSYGSKAKFFYYMAEKPLAEKIKVRLPLYAGLLSVEAGRVFVEVGAMCNQDSTRLSLKECVKMARSIVNYSMSLEFRLEKLVNPLGFAELFQSCGDTCYPPPGPPAMAALIAGVPV